jgi:hypothetical protein
MGPRPDLGAASGEQKDILRGLRTNHQTGGCEASSRVFLQAAENGCQDTVEEPAIAQVK